MRVGLDPDGLLDERPDFFAFLTAALRSAGHFVAVLTYRDPASRPKTEAQLSGWGVAYDELHFARSLSDKGRLAGVGEGTTVFKIRNGGNFDFARRKWLSTAKLTRLLCRRYLAAGRGRTPAVGSASVV